MTKVVKTIVASSAALATGMTIVSSNQVKIAHADKKNSSTQLKQVNYVDESGQKIGEGFIVKNKSSVGQSNTMHDTTSSLKLSDLPYSYEVIDNDWQNADLTNTSPINVKVRKIQTPTTSSNNSSSVNLSSNNKKSGANNKQVKPLNSADVKTDKASGATENKQLNATNQTKSDNQVSKLTSKEKNAYMQMNQWRDSSNSDLSLWRGSVALNPDSKEPIGQLATTADYPVQAQYTNNAKHIDYVDATGKSLGSGMITKEVGVNGKGKLGLINLPFNYEPANMSDIKAYPDQLTLKLMTNYDPKTSNISYVGSHQLPTKSNKSESAVILSNVTGNGTQTKTVTFVNSKGQKVGTGTITKTVDRSGVVPYAYVTVNGANGQFVTDMSKAAQMPDTLEVKASRTELSSPPNTPYISVKPENDTYDAAQNEYIHSTSSDNLNNVNSDDESKKINYLNQQGQSIGEGTIRRQITRGYLDHVSTFTLNNLPAGYVPDHPDDLNNFPNSIVLRSVADDAKTSNENVQPVASVLNAENGGYEPSKWGQMNLNDWTVTQNGDNYVLSNYTGDRLHIIIPNDQDFIKAGKLKSGQQVEISRDTLYNLMHSSDPKLQGKATLAVSKTGNGTVIAIDNNGNSDNTVSLEKVFSNAKGDSTLSSNYDLNNLDVSHVNNLQGAFEYDNLTSLDGISKWNTSNVQNMKMAFAGNKITNLNALSNWDTSNVKDMSYAFVDNGKLSDLSGIAGWNVTNANNVSPIIEGDNGNDASVRYLDLSAWTPQDSHFAGGTVSRAIPDLKGAIWVMPKDQLNKGIEFQKEYVTKWMDQNDKDEDFLMQFVENGDTSDPNAIFNRAFDYINNNFNAITFSNGDTAKIPFLITDLNTSDKSKVAEYVKNLAMQAAQKEQTKLGDKYEVKLDPSVDTSDPVALANAKFIVSEKTAKPSDSTSTNQDSGKAQSDSNKTATKDSDSKSSANNSTESNDKKTTSNSETSSNDKKSTGVTASKGSSSVTASNDSKDSTTSKTEEVVKSVNTNVDPNAASPSSNAKKASSADVKTTSNTKSTDAKKSSNEDSSTSKSENNTGAAKQNSGKANKSTSTVNNADKASHNQDINSVIKPVSTNSNKANNTGSSNKQLTGSSKSNQATPTSAKIDNAAKSGEKATKLSSSSANDNAKPESTNATHSRNISTKKENEHDADQTSGQSQNSLSSNSVSDAEDQSALPQTGNSQSNAGVLVGTTMLATMASLGIAHRRLKASKHR